MIRSFRGTTPSIAVSAYVDPSAVIIGDVTVGERSSIWPHVTIRGDVDHIAHRRGNQHSGWHRAALRRRASRSSIGDRVTVGHLAMLHGCTVEDDALIGIGAIVLNGARIGKGAVVAAGSLVPEGAEVPAGMLALGVPAKPRRPVTPKNRCASPKAPSTTSRTPRCIRKSLADRASA